MEISVAHAFDLETSKNIYRWLHGSYDEDTKERVRELIEQHPEEASDAFYTTLKFGTSGLRGIIGPGTNRMNVYTVRAASQGLANYLLSLFPNERIKAFIGYDSRKHSQLFAEETAKVLAANGFEIYLCKELRPTPLVSFGCRYKNCHTAIMITASHNPPEYNGFKVYWNQGEQVIAPHDKGILNEIDKIIDPIHVRYLESIVHPLITIVDDEIDNAYIHAGSSLQHYPEKNSRFGHNLKVVYTSMHGTGMTLVPKMLGAWGFSQIEYVAQQVIPDGSFPTVTSPNPEDPGAMKLGIEKMKESQADLLIATDPDADRVGVGVKHEGEIVLLNGHQIACLCLSHVCQALSSQGRMPASAAFIKDLTTTDLFKAICDSYDKACFDVLPGFKYVAKKIKEWDNSSTEGYEFVFGGEESYGYLLGTLTRDKDGVIASALICEAALHAKLQGKTLVDMLNELYETHGVFVEELISLDFRESKKGNTSILACMHRLRTQLPSHLNGIEICFIEDLRSSTVTNLITGQKTPLDISQANILILRLIDGSKLIVRPSGTEPKIKLYCATRIKPEKANLEQTLIACQTRSRKLLNALREWLVAE